jgi:Arc/MetJ family transcription regulator
LDCDEALNKASFGDKNGSLRRKPMRTTITLDDDLIEKAQTLTGQTERSALMREALKALIERETARRLARLGGSEPDLVAIPRRQPEPA